MVKFLHDGVVAVVKVGQLQLERITVGDVSMELQEEFAVVLNDFLYEFADCGVLLEVTTIVVPESITIEKVDASERPGYFLSG